MKILLKISLILLLGLSNMTATASPNVVWEPQAGSQELFLSCPIFECLYEGTRGPGKTDALLMDYAQFVGQGFGAAWRGILFRNEYKHLEDVITKSQKWFPRIFPDATYNESKYVWKFGTGEKLYFRHAKRESDYWNYHGHEYPWIAWEELTNWADDGLYLKMMSVCRSSTPGMPRRYRSTCNPFGKGHNWVKARFIDPAPRGVVVQDEEGRERVCLHGSIWENKILLKNDPDYIKNLQSQSGAVKEAWLYGNWDIVAGGMFDDVWNKAIHIMEPFEIPATWRLDRSFDWGSSKPYAVGWWAESDGCDIKMADGSTRSTR
ncbi:MAG: terminase, partial [Planctomycetota bacterium]